MIDDLILTKELSDEHIRRGQWHRKAFIDESYRRLEPEAQHQTIRSSRPGPGWFLMAHDGLLVLRSYDKDAFEATWCACTYGAVVQAKIGRIIDLNAEIARLAAERDALVSDLADP